jgi:hypothetical protein
MREGSFRATSRRWLDDSIHAGYSIAARQPGALPAYERLLRHVRSRTTLLRPSDRAADNRNLLNAGLLTMSVHHADWLRPIEAWCPQPGSDWRSLTSLAHHLFATYPVPAFMTSAWFDLPPGEFLPQQAWYKHLGRGHNIRTASLPLRFTRAMAHRFGQAPDHFRVHEALRWAQVRGLGGSEALARTVVATRLGTVLENEDFWESVLWFFVNHPRLDLAQVGPVVDFLQSQKFTGRDGISPEGVFGPQPPPRPDYSVKGRTVASILRQVESWHQELACEGQHACVSWRRAPFRGFLLVEGDEAQGNMQAWTITELLTSRALFLEGQAMQHCVASYTGRCVRRETSIWSLQRETNRGRYRRATVEVDLRTRTIRQARRKCNQRVSAEELALIERWAAEQGLKVAPWLRC